MKNISHTPAPWNFVTAHKGLAVHPCHFYYEGEVTDTDIANARLIAAAPDLLLALIDAMYQHDHKHLTPDEHWYHKAKRAIDKAKGA